MINLCMLGMDTNERCEVNDSQQVWRLPGSRLACNLDASGTSSETIPDTKWSSKVATTTCSMIQTRTNTSARRKPSTCEGRDEIRVQVVMAHALVKTQNEVNLDKRSLKNLSFFAQW
jgi:hypothetical protein